MRKIFLSIFIVTIISCGKKSIPITEKKEELNMEYYEDLAEFRALINDGEGKNANSSSNTNSSLNPPPLTTDVLYINEKVDAILDQKAAKNRNIKYANGYRIQLYVGRDRKLVDDAKIYIYQTYPNTYPYLTYSLPIYKLKIGDFITRADAERLLNQLKHLYPDAIIIAEKIDVKRSFGKE